MGTSISQRFADVVLSAAFAVSQLLAQTSSNISPNVRLGQDVQIAEGTPSTASAVVSVDVLRHPMTKKVRLRLLKAMEKMESGQHEAAIQELQETLAKYPDSAAYVDSLLGVEYVKTDRFQAAISSFEQAVLLLPHVATAHYNFGLALVCAGDYDRAAQEVQRALELDPTNPRIQARLNALLGHKRSGN
jgi:predicted Zn-dependent protease